MSEEPSACRYCFSEFSTNVLIIFLHLDRRAEEEQESDRKEREALLSTIEEHKRLEAENEEKIKKRNLSYQRDLEMQIDYQRRMKTKQMEEEEREFRMGQVSSKMNCG